uniref:Putative secreted protein synganglion overexpressed n=1 Tax=Rhipicephalus microplus TaxID=6941 RepID=A0A6M2DBW7_RHIMP
MIRKLSRNLHAPAKTGLVVWLILWELNCSFFITLPMHSTPTPHQAQENLLSVSTGYSTDCFVLMRQSYN